jgi:hypothetical protein
MTRSRVDLAPASGGFECLIQTQSGRKARIEKVQPIVNTLMSGLPRHIWPHIKNYKGPKLGYTRLLLAPYVD